MAHLAAGSRASRATVLQAVAMVTDALGLSLGVEALVMLSESDVRQVRDAYGWVAGWAMRVWFARWEA